MNKISSLLLLSLLTSPLMAQVRPMNTDRPGKGESPYSVAKGHLQLETEIYSRTTKKAGGTETTTSNYGVLNPKYGLTTNSDIQLALPSYTHIKTETAGAESTINGVGDLTLRYKYNLAGNDEGALSIAAMTYVKAPTAKTGLTNEKWEGGVMLPVSINTEFGLNFSSMIQVDRRYNQSADRFQTDYSLVWTVGRNIYGNLSGFVELYSKFSDEKAYDNVGTFDVGFTYLVNPSLQIDFGSYFGLTSGADDNSSFLGLSFFI